MLSTSRTICTVSLAALIAANPAHAQEQETGDDLLPGATCMVRTGEGGNATAIIVPKRSEPALLEKGFRPEPCSNNFGTPLERTEWRDLVCNLATDPDEYFQSQAEKALGERPAVLCGLAEMVVGAWTRNGGRGK